MVAWPMRAGCAFLADPALANANAAGSDAALLAGVRQFAAVFYNRSGVEAECLYNGQAAAGRRKGDFSFRRRRRPMTRRERDGDGDRACPGQWDYQYCTQMVQPFASNGITDMFYPPSPWDQKATAEGCLNQFGVTQRSDWANVGFPGSRLEHFSNIVFTNGYLDPWSGGGVLRNISVERDVLAFVLPNGAHHLDFMWSTPEDPDDALEARDFIAAAVSRWTKR